MTRKAFLVQLRIQLWLRLSPDERDAVLRDYEEYFAAGIAEGRSEEELCRRFGSPWQAAREIKRAERWRFPLAGYGVQMLLVLTLLVMVSTMLFTELFGGTTNSISNALLQLDMNFPIIGFVLFCLSLFSLLTAYRRVGQEYCYRRTTACTVAAGVLVAMVSTIVVSVFNLFGFMQWWENKGMALNQLGPICALCMICAMLLALLLWLYAASCAHHLARWLVVISPLCAMLLSILWDCFAILHTMNDPEALRPALWYGVERGLWQLLLVPLALWLAYRKERLWMHK